MKYLALPFILISTLLFTDLLHAQQRSTPVSSQFRLAEGMVRIAEAGQLADTVSVWGDINAPGRYVIPRGTNVDQLISYARGPVSVRTGETLLDWSNLRLEITITSYNKAEGTQTVQNHQFQYRDQFPLELREYKLRNDDIVTFEIKRRPAFVDYVRVIAPIVSTVATTLLIIDRL